MHLMSSFDITKGVIRDAAPEGVDAAQAAGLGDHTSYTSVSELNGMPAYTIRTYDDALPRRVALSELDLSAGPIRSRAMTAEPPVALRF